MSDDSKVNSSTLRDSISTEVGIKAAEIVAQIADANDIPTALAGGIAMHIYGFTRATTDVEMLARSVLPLEATRRIDFGGEGYDVKVDDRNVPVDVIVRDDKLAKIYQAALAQAKTTDVGLKIVSPEWLVVMKHFSPRAKDRIDLTWLLQEEGLVDRKQIESNLTKAIGEDAAFYVVADLDSDYAYADFLKAREKGKNN
ncbi:MAG: hypothetical protein IT174_09880 [Acidobacteria bacterium]|nr:hypothetical protein [Acidobacteriota bacterium]